MKTGQDHNQRLLRILQAPAQVQIEIDRVLDGKTQPRGENHAGPLLLGMTAAAKVLGVSRTTLHRIVASGRLARTEILPGSFRIRAEDLQELAKGNRGGGK